jgi:hypothetical protein
MVDHCFEPGDIVKNTSGEPVRDKIGVLLDRCITHSDYWNVLITDDIVTWFEPNMEKFQTKDSNYGKFGRKRSN